MKRMTLWMMLCGLVLTGWAFNTPSWARGTDDAQDDAVDTVESAQPATDSTEDESVVTESVDLGDDGGALGSGDWVVPPDEDMTPGEYLQSKHALTYPVVVDAMTTAGGPTVLSPARIRLSEGQLVVAWAKSHNKLYGFSSQTRTWDAVEYTSATEFSPIIAGGTCVGVLGKNVVAYSADTGKWDSVSVEADVPLAALNVSTGFAWFSSEGRLYAFRSSRGTWVSTSLENAQDAAGKAKLLDDLANKSDESAAGKEKNDSPGDDYLTRIGFFDGQMKVPDPEQEGIWTSDVGVMSSPERDALYGFSFVTGQWTKIEIEPQEKIIPIVSGAVCAVVLDGDVAAYSGKTGHWDILKLDQPITSGPSVSQNLVTVRTKSHMYTFAEHGTHWTSPTDTSLREHTRQSATGRSRGYAPNAPIAAVTRWMKVLKAVNACLPVEEGEPNPDISLQKRIHIEAIFPRRVDDLGEWHTAVAQSDRNDGFHPEDKEKPPAGPGYIVSVRGYHIYNHESIDFRVKGLTFVKNTLMANLRKRTVERDGEVIPVGQKGISHPVIISDALDTIRWDPTVPLGGTPNAAIVRGTDSEGDAADEIVEKRLYDRTTFVLEFAWIPQGRDSRERLSPGAGALWSSRARPAVAGSFASMLGTGTAMLDRTWRNAEEESLNIAEKLQDQSKFYGNKHPELIKLRQQLRDSVTKAFRARTESQRQRMKAMDKKLAKIRKSLEARQDLQERIIERRIEELLDPQVNWHAARESVAAPAGESLLGMPAVGRPIGLPGPPSIPADAPGPGVVHPSTKLRIRNSETTSPSPAAATVVWDKAELLLQQLEERFEPIDAERTKIDQLVKQIEPLRKSWSESTPEERVAVVQIIRKRGPFGRGFGFGGRRAGGGGMRLSGSLGRGSAGGFGLGSRRVDEDEDERPASSGSDDDDETQSGSLADNEVQYELARLSALTRLCDVMEKNLQRLNEAIDDYSRPWQRYTDECMSVELNYSEAQIELNAASRLFDREQSLSKSGVGSESNLLKYRVALEKAEIGVKRARLAIDRIKRIENRYPQLKPDQHSAFLKQQQTRLSELRAEIDKSRSELPEVKR